MNVDSIWLGVSIVGQTLFSMRFVVQWIHSERLRKSVIPVAFWYFSLAGSLTLLAYMLHRDEYVLAFGQATGLVVYIRNLYLIWREKKAPIGVSADG